MSDASRLSLALACSGGSMSAPSVSDPENADEVVRLREWGTDRTYELGSKAVRYTIGSLPGCPFRLAHQDLLPEQAQLYYSRSQWWIRDLGADGAVRQDGVPCAEFALRGGVEIGVGDTTLVVETPRLIGLRSFCARLLGWGRDRLPSVDHALRAIRLSTTGRALLALQGDGDLVLIALALHRRTLRGNAPFVVCNPRRVEQLASVRAPANYPALTTALAQAEGGSLCVRNVALPREIQTSLPQIWRRAHSPQFIVCIGREVRQSTPFGPSLIELPPLRLRETELPRIVDEYADEALAVFGAASSGFTDADRRWVMQRAARSLPEIEKATRRLVALRSSDGPENAAQQLGMARISLTRWLERRGLSPTELLEQRPSTHKARRFTSRNSPDAQGGAQ